MCHIRPSYSRVVMFMDVCVCVWVASMAMTRKANFLLIFDFVTLFGLHLLVSKSTRSVLIHFEFSYIGAIVNAIADNSHFMLTFLPQNLNRNGMATTHTFTRRIREDDIRETLKDIAEHDIFRYCHINFRHSLY